MIVPPFDRTVEIAKEQIEADRFEFGYDSFARNADFHEFIKRDSPRILSLDFARHVDGWSASPLDPAPPLYSEEMARRRWRRSCMELIAASKLGGDEFLALRHLVAAALERGETLHPVVTEWLTSYLRGEIVEPKTAGRPKRESTAIDGAIRRAVETLVAKGMTATRSDTSPHTSACDAVAKAMLELGLTPSSYGQVARIWGKRAPRLTVEIEEDLSETPKE